VSLLPIRGNQTLQFIPLKKFTKKKKRKQKCSFYINYFTFFLKTIPESLGASVRNKKRVS